MQEELLKDLRLNHIQYQSKVLEKIKDCIYQYNRYGVKFSLALGATYDEVDMKGFSSFIREADRFIVLDEHMACIAFTFTDSADGIKAASNLLSKFETMFFSKSIYLSIVNADDCEQPEQQIEKLFDVLTFAIEHNMHNVPLSDISF